MACQLVINRWACFLVYKLLLWSHYHLRHTVSPWSHYVRDFTLCQEYNNVSLMKHTLKLMWHFVTHVTVFKRCHFITVVALCLRYHAFSYVPFVRDVTHCHRCHTLSWMLHFVMDFKLCHIYLTLSWMWNSVKHITLCHQCHIFLQMSHFVMDVALFTL